MDSDLVTGADIVADAIREFNGVDLGGSLEAAQVQFGLRKLNRLISTWKTERLFVRTISIHEHDLAAGISSYSIGPQGDFAQNMPRDIESWSAVYGDHEYSRCKPVDALAWQAIPDKHQSADYPQILYFDKTKDASGRGRVWVWPVPAVAAVKLLLYAWVPPIDRIESNQKYRFEDGYERMVVSGLAAELAATGGWDVDRDTFERLQRVATEAKAMVKRGNTTRRTAQIPVEWQVGVRRGGHYNIYSDSSH